MFSPSSSISTFLFLADRGPIFIVGVRVGHLFSGFEADFKIVSSAAATTLFTLWEMLIIFYDPHRRTNLVQRGRNIRIVTLGGRRRRVATFIVPIRVRGKLPQQLLTLQIQILDRQLQNLPLHFVVGFAAVLGTVDVLRKVRVLQVLLQIIDPVQNVTRLPQKIFERHPQINPQVVIVMQEPIKVGRQLRRFDHFTQQIDRNRGRLELVLAARDRRPLLLPKVVRLDDHRLVYVVLAETLLQHLQDHLRARRRVAVAAHVDDDGEAMAFAFIAGS